MNSEEKLRFVRSRVEEAMIIPVLVIPDLESGLRVCEILFENGLPLAEITFRTATAADLIREASKRFPEMLIGAGTVLSIKDLHAAFDAGAKFAVSPGTNPKILEDASRLEIPFIPGISNASDIEAALEFSCKVLKFFPAEPLGGLKMLKAIAAPYRHLGVKYIPLGGINSENMNDYLSNTDVLAIGGSWLAEKQLLEKRDWKKISDNIKEAVSKKIKQQV